ncbi:hypothetical protein [Methylibium sp.]|uniref:hypothetical protein n=1 Tax=Methylibium sp. TaxID=2067992 RepID=UPI0017F8648B|nr:hypothetical protein [Methylibium sp.]MBA3591539.1 hypothetical protein [Methylibium sp.]
MPTYLHKHTASAKYVARFEWEGATFPVPAGHTRELETGANRAQAAADLAAQAAADFTGEQAGLREQARHFIQNDPRPEMKALRSVALLVLDENNLLRAWIEAFKVQTAACTSLADFKTRVAGLPATPARTPAQLLNAMVAKVTDGSAD